MDPKTKRGAKKELIEKTPESSQANKKRSKIEGLGNSFIENTPTPIKFNTKVEMEKREDDEVCKKHENPIIAFEERSGESLCEKWVYLEEVNHPIFTAVVAKQIKKRFDVEFSTFERLWVELMAIDQLEVKNRIQESVTQFFDAIRAKWDELEEKTVAKIEDSANLNELVSTLNEMHSYMEENNVAAKYESFRANLDSKISEIRYTYVTRRKTQCDEIISSLEDDNRQLANAVEKANKMINAIFECSQDDDKISHTLNDLVTGLMLIDQKRPDYSDDTQVRKRKNMKEVGAEVTGMVKQEINFNDSELREERSWIAEKMNEGYINRDNVLYKREIQDGKVIESEIMKLKLHLQKVITVPSSENSRVFLFGGAKDAEGKQAINNCFEINLKKKSTTAVEKFSTPKLSFAAVLSPDAESIYVAGGSKGENISTNEVEVFNVATKKWTQLPSLNQPRFSASLIICENTDMYCFGGVDNDPKDPTKFLTLKTIETFNLSSDNQNWEVIKISLPYKTSSPGAIDLGHKAFIVFGGWNKKTLKTSCIIRASKEDGDYVAEDAGEMAAEDTFVFNGLLQKNPDTKEFIVFGTSYAHVYNKNEKTFKIIE